jgi:hypothetical protein
MKRIENVHEKIDFLIITLRFIFYTNLKFKKEKLFTYFFILMKDNY